MFFVSIMWNSYEKSLYKIKINAAQYTAKLDNGLERVVGSTEHRMAVNSRELVSVS